MEKFEVLITLAACGSFTETARRMYCSQSTVSKQIQQLEEMFDAVFFERLGKSVRLTPQGEIMLDYAKRITGLLKEADEQIRAAARTSGSASTTGTSVSLALL